MTKMKMVLVKVSVIMVMLGLGISVASALTIPEGGTYEPGSIFSDTNWECYFEQNKLHQILPNFLLPKTMIQN